MTTSIRRGAAVFAAVALLGLPVLAHAERYYAVQEDPKRLTRFWERGGVVQVNADSLLGSWGEKARKCGKKMLAEGLVDVIASDGHRVSRRPPVLNGVYEWLDGRFEEKNVTEWLVENPGGIVRNDVLEPADHP